MFRASISNLFRFLAGILLVQGATALLVYSGIRLQQSEAWLLFTALAIVIGVLASFWFSSLAGHLSKDQLAFAREKFSREREQLRLRAEREKTKVIKQSHQQISKERNRMQSRASLKVGVAFAGAAGVGLVMMLTQFVTLGLLVVTTAGGAFGGYLLRGRREQRRIKEDSQDIPSARFRFPLGESAHSKGASDSLPAVVEPRPTKSRNFGSQSKRTPGKSKAKSKPKKPEPNPGKPIT